MEKIKTDVLIIGAGSGGLSVAAGAVQMGASVVLLEAHKMGGDCLNYGCVPSKALIASGKTAYAMSHADRYGIASVAPQVNYAAAKDHVADVISQIEPVDSQERFEGLGVRVIREYGRFVSPTEVEAGEYRITARRVVIATGSSPFVPPIPGLDQVPYITNESLWELREQPEHLLVIGGGPIGMEMAQAHLRLGSKVTVIEGAKALGKDDPEMAEIVLDSLREEGLEIAEGSNAKEVRGKEGAIEVETEDGRVFKGTHILVAVGRRANTDGLDLDKAGIKTTRTGIAVDDSLRTSNKKVYAIGDVAGGLQFTHVAGYHAGVIIRSMLFGLPAKATTRHIPWATYTQPELSQVGLTEAQARKEHGTNLEVVRFHYSHNDRAIAERKTRGLIKVMVVKGRPVGASIAGEQAGELINLWALVIANKMKMGQIANMVAPYPTIGELNKRAAGAYFSPRLFESDTVKKVVGFVQKWLPWHEKAGIASMLNSLSGRFLILTTVFVMLAEVLIFVPSIARYREDFLLNRLERAQIASLALLADDMIDTELEAELLLNAGVFNVVLRRDELRQLVLSSPMPSEVSQTFDLREATALTLIRDAMARLIDPENETIRVIGNPFRDGGLLIEITLDTTELRMAMIDYGLRILVLSAVISVFTAGLLFLAVRVLLVKPIKGVVGHMQSYAKAPEDARRIIQPSASVTELLEAEKALQSLQTQLTQALKQKERLAQLGGAVARVSHDLRNILTSAQLFTDRIEMSEDPAVKRMAPKLVNSITRAVSLCESTLAFGRAEEPAPTLTLINLAQLVSDVLDSERLAIGEFDLSLSEDVPGNLMVRADPEQMYRVLSNLVRNARQAIIGTGQPGEINVAAKICDDAWCIDVTDTGPGLPPKAVEYLFQPFQGGARKGGSGLGLAIAEELARGHGGTLTLVKTDESGTAFRIRLPMGGLT